MGDVINLRTVRKARQRTAAAHQASANRAIHGLTKAEKLADRIGRARREAMLDGAKLTEAVPAKDRPDRE